MGAGIVYFATLSRAAPQGPEERPAGLRRPVATKPEIDEVLDTSTNNDAEGLVDGKPKIDWLAQSWRRSGANRRFHVTDRRQKRDRSDDD